MDSILGHDSLIIPTYLGPMAIKLTDRTILSADKWHSEPPRTNKLSLMHGNPGQNESLI